NALHFGVGPRDRDTRFEPRDCGEMSIAPRCVVPVQRKRDPELGELRILEARRHHPNYRVRHSVELDRRTEDSPIAAVPPLKQRVTQHDDGRTADTVLVRTNPAPEHRLY